MRVFESLKVLYHGRLTGGLTTGVNDTCLFRYNKGWFDTGFSVSPLKLPLKPGLFETDYLPFQGSFGVFEDCLPGGYGEYILQKNLKKQGINYYGLNTLQKLSIVDSSDMGVLYYVPDDKITTLQDIVDLDAVQQTAADILSDKTDKSAGMLYAHSGNSGDVRSKIFLWENERGWIVRLRHLNGPIGSGTIEFIYNQAAKEAGIAVPRFKLFDGRYFDEGRLDQTPSSERIHIVTTSGLLNESVNPPKMDYKTLLALTGYITQDPIEMGQQFRRMAFNYYAKNFNDHARNFSFLYINGKWKLSPAYDMTHDNPLGQHASTVCFKANPTKEDFIGVGMPVQMTRRLCSDIIEEVKPIGQQLVRRLKEKSYCMVGFIQKYFEQV